MHIGVYVYMENNVNGNKSIARCLLVLCVGVPPYMLEVPEGLDA